MSRDLKSDYYDVGGIEVFDVIKAKLTPEQFKGFLLGNVIKYSLRMMHKDPVAPERDAEKAAYYAQWLNDEFHSYYPLKAKLVGKCIHGIDKRLACRNCQSLLAAQNLLDKAVEKYKQPPNCSGQVQKESIRNILP